MARGSFQRFLLRGWVYFVTLQRQSQCTGMPNDLSFIPAFYSDIVQKQRIICHSLPFALQALFTPSLDRYPYRVYNPAETEGY
jgi:hypothetical protein